MPTEKIPPPCAACRPTGGSHRWNAAHTALERCDCPRGKWIAAAANRKRKHTEKARIQREADDPKMRAAGDTQ